VILTIAVAREGKLKDTESKVDYLNGDDKSGNKNNKPQENVLFMSRCLIINTS
jgi:hypothetical protein